MSYENTLDPIDGHDVDDVDDISTEQEVGQEQNQDASFKGLTKTQERRRAHLESIVRQYGETVRPLISSIIDACQDISIATGDAMDTYLSSLSNYQVSENQAATDMFMEITGAFAAITEHLHLINNLISPNAKNSEREN